MYIEGRRVIPARALLTFKSQYRSFTIIPNLSYTIIILIYIWGLSASAFNFRLNLYCSTF